jgi:Amt family ammonium transporter
MVAVTPAAGFVKPLSAMLLGAIAALASFGAIRVRPKLGLDDSLDVFAVHGVAATLGALLTGVFASTAVNSAGADGSLALVGKQAVGVFVTMIWSGVLSFALFKLVGAITPLRAEAEDEWSGLDQAEAGERAYIYSDSNSGSGSGGSTDSASAAVLGLSTK